MILLIKASKVIAFIRLITGSVEIICAALIYQSRSPKTIIRLSTLMGVLGPLALLLGLIIGITSLEEMSPYKVGLILVGALFLIIGSFI
ncbi:MAG: DUF2619 domain-containing protein [Firmicutes bacterium]|nr:DUF2619 domain-containing protein [Bacillota bacterium]MDD4693046.1 DUF2619 domain-containing protein [Bacillota bacterium]